MGGYRPAPAAVARGAAPDWARRSHLIGPLAVLVLFVGLLLGTYTILVPALLGLLLLSSAASFLSMRLNPFTPSFYIPSKPSWTAIAVVGLVGLLLLSAAWTYWRDGVAPVLPRSLP